jgi:hypothetical protein
VDCSEFKLAKDWLHQGTCTVEVLSALWPPLLMTNGLLSGLPDEVIAPMQRVQSCSKTDLWHSKARPHHANINRTALAPGKAQDRIQHLS